jgi:hypothetical protein
MANTDNVPGKPKRKRGWLISCLGLVIILILGICLASVAADLIVPLSTFPEGFAAEMCAGEILGTGDATGGYQFQGVWLATEPFTPFYPADSASLNITKTCLLIPWLPGLPQSGQFGIPAAE